MGNASGKWLPLLLIMAAIIASAVFALIGPFAPGLSAQSAPIPQIVELPTPATVVESAHAFSRDGFVIHGTLALPATPARGMPIVVIVAGSGPTDRNANGPLVNTNAYAMLAWALAGQGIASLRYDKRGIGRSAAPRDADPTRLTLDAYVADLQAAAETLATDARFSSVILLGHSEGAGLAIQAANRGAPVSRVIMVSPQGRKLRDLVREQFARVTDSATVARIDTAFSRLLRGEDPGEVPPIARSFLAPATANFLRSFAAYDPPAEVRRFPGQLLIVQGATDIQTTMEDARMLAAAQPRATLVELPGVNHVLKEVESTDPQQQLASYRDPHMPLAASVATTIVQWIKPPLAHPGAAEFESQLDSLRRRLAIPGMSAIVMAGDEIVWEGALGVADIESRKPVTPTTQFHLASLTKTFASTIVLQLVEEGRVNLDDPIGKYGLTLPGSGVIRVRHLLSHTSEGTPGERFRYNGNRFALLDQVIRRATGASFARRVMDRIVTPLGLDRTAPNPLDPAAFAASGRDATAYIAGMATGYGVDARGRPVAVLYPASFSSAAGLVSTAREVARYSRALDSGRFLSEAMRTLAYTPARGAGNRTLPYGLGWFTSAVSGHTLVWHYGYWTGNSSLIIKEPSRGLTFVALTNSDQLSARFNLGAGDLMSSTIAQAFVNAFVTGPMGERK